MAYTMHMGIRHFRIVKQADADQFRIECARAGVLTHLFGARLRWRWVGDLPAYTRDRDAAARMLCETFEAYETAARALDVWLAAREAAKAPPGTWQVARNPRTPLPPEPSDRINPGMGSDACYADGCLRECAD